MMIRLPFTMKVISLFCGLLFCLAVQGQKNQFDFSYGVAFPLGKFQQRDLDSEGSGFAKRGTISQLSYSREIKEKLRLIISYQGMSNPIDNTELLKEFISQFPTVEYSSVSFRSWEIRSFHLGASRSFNLRESKFSLSASLMIGYSYLRRPSLFISSSITPQYLIRGKSESEAERWAPSFVIELQSGYTFSEKVSLIAKLNYFQSEARMSFERIPSFGGNDPIIIENVSYLQKIKLLSLSGGLRFHF